VKDRFMNFLPWL